MGRSATGCRRVLFAVSMAASMRDMGTLSRWLFATIKPRPSFEMALPYVVDMCAPQSLYADASCPASRVLRIDPVMGMPMRRPYPEDDPNDYAEAPNGYGFDGRAGPTFHDGASFWYLRHGYPAVPNAVRCGRSRYVLAYERNAYCGRKGFGRAQGPCATATRDDQGVFGW